MTNFKKPTLDELGVKYITDKSSLFHDYLTQYERFFPEPEKIEKVVELGLQRRSGQWKHSPLPSVNMWLEFFPNAKIYGFDKQNLQSFNRFTFFRGDQGRIKHHMEFGERTGWDLDFVIDDASHRCSHQLLSLLFFFPRLKSGGVYICEDTRALVQKEYDEKFWPENYFEQYLKTMDCTWEWIPSASVGEKSSLVIVKK